MIFELLFIKSKEPPEKARNYWKELSHLNKRERALNPGVKDWNEKENPSRKAKIWSTLRSSNSLKGGILKEKCFGFARSFDERGSNKTFKYTTI